MDKVNLDFNKIISITIYGAPDMVGTKNDFNFKANTSHGIVRRGGPWSEVEDHGLIHPK